MKEAVKGSLLGLEEPTANLSASYRATFLSNAKKDEESGEPVMGPDEFIDAIAPADEDYVSARSYGHQLIQWCQILTMHLGSPAV
jgi:solute carrier family 25 aspartate/glutamate transporter 12/13